MKMGTAVTKLYPFVYSGLVYELNTLSAVSASNCLLYRSA